MFDYQTVETAVLDVAYSERNHGRAKVAVLLHGWPDRPACWKDVGAMPAEVDSRVLAPAPRGYYPTRFLRPEKRRSGTLSALSQVILDFLDALDIKRDALIDQDSGGVLRTMSVI